MACARWRVRFGDVFKQLEDLLMTLSIETIELETRPLMPAFGVEILDVDIASADRETLSETATLPISARRHIAARSVSRPGGANRFHEGLRHTGRKRLSGMVRPGLSGDLYDLEQSREWPQDRRSRRRS